MKKALKQRTPQFIGKFVFLQENFLRAAHDLDASVPVKFRRPYLVVALTIPNKERQQLFAVPMQSNVKSNKNNLAYTQLCYRLESFAGSPSGLIYAQMIPITAQQIQAAKTNENAIPSCRNKRYNVLRNLTAWKMEQVPETGRDSFLVLQKMLEEHADDPLALFDNMKFQAHYQIVADAIFQATVRLKNEKLPVITQKANQYLKMYYDFKHHVVQSKSHHKATQHDHHRLGVPKMHTKIDKLLDFLEAYNSVDFLQQADRWRSQRRRPQITPTRRERNDRYFEELDAEFNYQKPHKKSKLQIKTNPRALRRTPRAMSAAPADNELSQ